MSKRESLRANVPDPHQQKETKKKKKKEEDDDDDNNGSLRGFVVVLYRDLAQSPEFDFLWMMLLLLWEVMLGYGIIQKIAYTEIDWMAYMQQVQAFLDAGELDYRNIRGDTGPLVYPAGFLYLFAFLRHVTGGRVRLAQYWFGGFYVATQAIVFSIYQIVLHTERMRFLTTTLHSDYDDDDDDDNTHHQDDDGDDDDDNEQKKKSFLFSCHRIWCWRLFMALLCLSKRLHSIFLLRLFNDGPTMMFLYGSLWLFMNQHWNAGCLFFSLAVSLKMNILLFAPGVFLILILQQQQAAPPAAPSHGHGTLQTFLLVFRRLLLCCALPQVILGAPFLATYPLSYLRKAFELDRVFFYQWTVNWRFLPEIIFVSKSWSLTLLLLHLTTLAILARRWCQVAWPVVVARTKHKGGGHKQQQLAPDFIVYTILVSNFVGIAFARTLHYQFYSWYFHSIPLLLWYHPNVPPNKSSFPWRRLLLCIIVMGAIEGAFLTFPATPTSSAILQIAHAIVLWHTKSPSSDDILLSTNESIDKDSKKTK